MATKRKRGRYYLDDATVLPEMIVTPNGNHASSALKYKKGISTKELQSIKHDKRILDVIQDNIDFDKHIVMPMVPKLGAYLHNSINYLYNDMQ